MRVACVMMQRNEDLCLHPWLVWHGYLFGFENLFVIDHGSEDRTVQETLALFEPLGVRILRLPATADYRQKGDFVGNVLAQADATGLYDLLFPLDCDEFITMRDTDGILNCDRDNLLHYLAGLPGGPAPFLVQENLLNVLGSPNGFWPAPYRKIFFAGGHSGTLDHGSHNCISNPAPAQPTRLVYVHFHHKPYATQIKMSREKLLPYVDVDNKTALANFQGIGWHLRDNLLKTAAEYKAMMTAGSEFFPALGEIFETLGIDPGFCEAE